MGEKLKVGIARVGETPELIEVDKDEWFKEVQGLVGGNVEFFYPPYEDIILAVNEEGLFTCQPNRVVFANQKMEDERYLECFEYKKPVKVGELIPSFSVTSWQSQSTMMRKRASRISRMTSSVSSSPTSTIRSLLMFSLPYTRKRVVGSIVTKSVST